MTNKNINFPSIEVIPKDPKNKEDVKTSKILTSIINKQLNKFWEELFWNCPKLAIRTLWRKENNDK